MGTAFKFKQHEVGTAYGNTAGSSIIASCWCAALGDGPVTSEERRQQPAGCSQNRPAGLSIRAGSHRRPAWQGPQWSWCSCWPHNSAQADYKCLAVRFHMQLKKNNDLTLVMRIIFYVHLNKYSMTMCTYKAGISRHKLMSPHIFNSYVFDIPIYWNKLTSDLFRLSVLTFYCI